MLLSDNSLSVWSILARLLSFLRFLFSIHTHSEVARSSPRHLPFCSPHVFPISKRCKISWAFGIPMFFRFFIHLGFHSSSVTYLHELCNSRTQKSESLGPSRSLENARPPCTCTSCATRRDRRRRVLGNSWIIRNKYRCTTVP